MPFSSTRLLRSSAWARWLQPSVIALVLVSLAGACDQPQPASSDLDARGPDARGLDAADVGTSPDLPRLVCGRRGFCRKDSDCPADSHCALCLDPFMPHAGCGEPFKRCVPTAPCTNSSDCGPNGYCAYGPTAIGCPSPTSPGTCLARLPLGCYYPLAPVCGCDGKSYGNDCFAVLNGSPIAARGYCETQGMSCNDLLAAFDREMANPQPCASQSDCHVWSHCGCTYAGGRSRSTLAGKLVDTFLFGANDFCRCPARQRRCPAPPAGHCVDGHCT